MHPFLLPDSADYDALGHGAGAAQPYACGRLRAFCANEVIPYVASRMPGYPLFLAAIYVLGGGVKTVMVLQALMGGMIVLLTYAVGRRVSQGTGLMAAMLVTVDPLSIGFSAALLTETPFTLCLMGAIWVCLRIVNGQWVRTWAMHGRPTRASAPVGAVRGGCGSRWAFCGEWVYLRASALGAIVPLGLAAASGAPPRPAVESGCWVWRRPARHCFRPARTLVDPQLPDLSRRPAADDHA